MAGAFVYSANAIPIPGLVRSPLIKEQRDVRGDQNWRQAI
jgi:hypothetical protein